MTHRQPPDAIEQAVEKAYTQDARRVYATLVRLLGGDFDFAEESMHDVFAVAVERWASNGVPAPVQAGMPWVVERAQACMNACGNVRRCTERTRRVVDFYLFLAMALVVTRLLIQRARPQYRWDGRPTTRRLP